MDPSRGIGMDLARYAEVVAHQRYFPQERRHEVAARLGLDPKALEAAGMRFRTVRATELATGRVELAQRFAAVFSRTLDRLNETRPSLESLGPLAGPASASPPWTSATPSVGMSQQAPAIHVVQAKAAKVLDAPRFSAGSVHAHFPTEQLSITAPAPLSSSSANPLPFGSGAVSTAADGSRAFRQSSGLNVTAAAHDAPPALPPGTQELTLREYTSLRVELQLFPDRLPAILARYRLTPDGLTATLDQWRVRFAADPPMRMEFARIYGDYAAWLKANPNKGP